MRQSKLFKNGAFVTMERNSVNGFYTVLVRTPSGEIHDKVSCDPYSEALNYWRSFALIARNLFR